MENLDSGVIGIILDIYGVLVQFNIRFVYHNMGLGISMVGKLICR